MFSATLNLPFLCAVTVLFSIVSAKWTIQTPEISAVTIGIGFQNDTTGWTSRASSSQLPSIARTDDGGKTWSDVKSTTGGTTMIVTAVAAGHEAQTDVQIFGVMFTSKYSLDGEHFQATEGAPIAGQDIKFQAGRMMMAGPSGPCFSDTGGKTYTCHRVSIYTHAPSSTHPLTSHSVLVVDRLYRCHYSTKPLGGMRRLPAKM
jgi:hypothetical protein